MTDIPEQAVWALRSERRGNAAARRSIVLCIRQQARTGERGPQKRT